jgi:hypothetical protein
VTGAQKDLASQRDPKERDGFSFSSPRPSLSPLAQALAPVGTCSGCPNCQCQNHSKIQARRPFCPPEPTVPLGEPILVWENGLPTWISPHLSEQQPCHPHMSQADFSQLRKTTLGARSAAQAVEHLPSKGETLSSNSSATKERPI